LRQFLHGFRQARQPVSPAAASVSFHARLRRLPQAAFLRYAGCQRIDTQLRQRLAAAIARPQASSRYAISPQASVISQLLPPG